MLCDLGAGQLNTYQGLGRFASAGNRARVAAGPWLAEARSFYASVISRPIFRVLATTLVVLCALLLSYAAARRSVDFPVYHYAARRMLSHAGPMYGPSSGIGWPQIYRYPPLFLLLFVPFALLPLRLAAIVWAGLKFGALGLLARALFSRLQTRGIGWKFVSLLPAVPYLAVEFHYGNVQFFIFALVAAALLCLERRPVLAAMALALATSVKVAPLFFLPYLIARRRTRVAALALVFISVFTLLPAAYFGWHANASLLRQWAKQELGVASTAGEPGIVGFPSQSMHSVLMRYFVSLNYAQLTDSDYPKLNVETFDPRTVELLWVILAAAGYLGLLLLARRPQSDELTMHAVAFCGLLLLQPFTQLGDLVILLWPVLVAVAALRDRADLPKWIRAALYLALFLMVLKPLIPDRNAQRFLQVLGVDFAATAILAVALIAECLLKARSARAAMLANHSILSLHIGPRGA